MSFDLTRLGCSLYDYFEEEIELLDSDECSEKDKESHELCIARLVKEWYDG